MTAPTKRENTNHEQSVNLLKTVIIAFLDKNDFMFSCSGDPGEAFKMGNLICLI